jgi:hypothetical protein
MRKIEAGGSIETAHRAKQICGQIFRYAVAVDMAAMYSPACGPASAP